MNDNKYDDGIGLVLSGGGAKGAFQIGVWQAICELGLDERVAAISGTSVGSINGAAIAAGNSIEKIKRLWVETINEVRSMDFEYLLEQLPDLIQCLWAYITGDQFNLPALLNRSKIEADLRELIPISWPDNAKSLYSTSLKVIGGFVGNNDTRFQLTRFNIGETKDWKKRVDKVLASAAIPWGFPYVVIDGEHYVDGGWTAKGGDNIPLAPIIQEHPELKTLIVICCNSRDIDENVVEKPQGVEIIEIRPEKPLPGIFDTYLDNPLIDNTLDLTVPDWKNIIRIWSGTLAFDREFTEQYINNGYITAKRILQSFCIRTAKLKFPRFCI